MNDLDNRNVKIPLQMLKRTAELLEYIDLTGYDPVIRFEYDNILSESRQKLRRVDLREAYGAIIWAQDKESRDAARMRYLQEKREIMEDAFDF